ncbi:MAG: LicD family protein, partial [Firmicutes bacterium]|nr:LicD family protein [Bacillota bacterium]
WVDIFPLDGLGNDIEEAKKIIAKNKRYVLQILNLEAGKKMNIKGRILYYLGRKNLNRLLKHNMMKNDFYSSKYVTAIGCVEPSTIYNGQSFRGIRKGIFEGNEFIIPKNSEDVLKTLYGDYMSFPPKEMRKPSHKIKVWIK